ncbi:hypothetical protein [Streptomyces sp. NPDC051994]|uniref:hypothetical protein n=1 Tax=unclassified Streptomyces TaxID=2593676 RepID=UPI0034317533
MSAPRSGRHALDIAAIVRQLLEKGWEIGPEDRVVLNYAAAKGGGDRRGEPNEYLARVIKAAGASHKSLARRVNELGAEAGIMLVYEHTSVAN